MPYNIIKKCHRLGNWHWAWHNLILRFVQYPEESNQGIEYLEKKLLCGTGISLWYWNALLHEVAWWMGESELFWCIKILGRWLDWDRVTLRWGWHSGKSKSIPSLPADGCHKGLVMIVTKISRNDLDMQECWWDLKVGIIIMAAWTRVLVQVSLQLHDTIGHDGSVSKSHKIFPKGLL